MIKRFGVLLIVIMFGLALACGSKEERKAPAKPASAGAKAESKDSPGETVKKFLKLINEGKATTAKNYMSTNSPDVEGMATSFFGKIPNVKINNEIIKGELAEITFETDLHKMSGKGGERASLIYNNGWKIETISVENVFYSFSNVSK